MDDALHPNLVRTQETWDAIAGGELAGLDDWTDTIVVENGPGAGPWRVVEGKDAFLNFAMQFIPFFEGTVASGRALHLRRRPMHHLAGPRDRDRARRGHVRQHGHLDRPHRRRRQERTALDGGPRPGARHCFLGPQRSRPEGFPLHLIGAFADWRATFQPPALSCSIHTGAPASDPVSVEGGPERFRRRRLLTR